MQLNNIQNGVYVSETNTLLLHYKGQSVIAVGAVIADCYESYDTHKP